MTSPSERGTSERTSFTAPSAKGMSQAPFVAAPAAAPTRFGSPPPRTLTPLEIADTREAGASGVPYVSWSWPASFFRDPQNPTLPLHVTYANHEGDVVNKVYVAPFFDVTSVGAWPRAPWPAGLDLQLGDLLIFQGHSVIVTGRDDPAGGPEISQMWWTRDVQFDYWQYGLVPPGDLGPQNGGYEITRDGLQDLLDRFGQVPGVAFGRPCTRHRLQPAYLSLGDFTYLLP